MAHRAIEPWALTIQQREISNPCSDFSVLGCWDCFPEFPVEQWIRDVDFEVLEGGTSDSIRLAISRKH